MKAVNRPQPSALLPTRLRLMAALGIALAAAGCNRTEAPAPAPPPPVAAPALSGPAKATFGAAPTASTPAPAPAPTGPTGGGAGPAVFATTCITCHGSGTGGAPALDDKANWAPRIAQGREVLYKRAIAGYKGSKGVHPPKGGNAALSEVDVRSAVDYMVTRAQ